MISDKISDDPMRTSKQNIEKCKSNEEFDILLDRLKRPPELRHSTYNETNPRAPKHCALIDALARQNDDFSSISFELSQEAIVQ